MKKRFLSLMLALAMIVGVLSPLSAFADTTSEPAAGPTIDTKVLKKLKAITLSLKQHLMFTSF